MPCCLLTLHTYGSWMPDRARGYVRRDQKGVLATDRVRSNQYRAQMNDAAVVWTKPQSEAVRDLLIAAADQQALRLHAVSIDASHVHVLTSWADGRDWAAVRRSLKYSLTRGLNARFGKRVWLPRGGSRKRVKDRAHFEHLISSYLPRHHAMFWREADA